MSLSLEESQELNRLEIAFEEAGGRGVELAERIDQLREKRDTDGYRGSLTVECPHCGGEVDVREARGL